MDPCRFANGSILVVVRILMCGHLDQRFLFLFSFLMAVRKDSDRFLDYLLHRVTTFESWLVVLWKLYASFDYIGNFLFARFVIGIFCSVCRISSANIGSNSFSEAFE